MQGWGAERAEVGTERAAVGDEGVVRAGVRQ